MTGTAAANVKKTNKTLPWFIFVTSLVLLIVGLAASSYDWGFGILVGIPSFVAAGTLFITAVILYIIRRLR
jgi:hypothetical protein